MGLRTIGFIATFVIGLLAAPLPAAAQRAETVHRIGYLADSKGRRKEAFLKGLRELGNLVIGWRFGRENSPNHAGRAPDLNQMMMIS